MTTEDEKNTRPEDLGPAELSGWDIPHMKRWPYRRFVREHPEITDIRCLSCGREFEPERWGIVQELHYEGEAVGYCCGDCFDAWSRALSGKAFVSATRPKCGHDEFYVYDGVRDGFTGKTNWEPIIYACVECRHIIGKKRVRGLAAET